jgi:hypothetical protein
MESAARPLRLDDPKIYRPRSPERSPFYAVLYQFFDRFTREYERRCARNSGLPLILREVYWRREGVG